MWRYEWLEWEALLKFSVEVTSLFYRRSFQGRAPKVVKPEGWPRWSHEPFAVPASQRVTWHTQHQRSRGQVLLRASLLSQPEVVQISGQCYFHSQFSKRFFFATPLILLALPVHIAPWITQHISVRWMDCMSPALTRQKGRNVLSILVPSWSSAQCLTQCTRSVNGVE